jgi:chorismate mutase
MDHETGLARLRECREAIDQIDVQIVALINERTKVVEEIGAVEGELERRREARAGGRVTPGKSCRRGCGVGG